jgi:uncharacterized membrane protein
MLQETFLKRFRDDVEMIEHRFVDGTTQLVPHWRHVHPPVRNTNEQLKESFTPLERAALFATVRVGSPGFFLIIFAWTVGWLGWNLLGPTHLRFDPAPAFVLWLFVSNMIQIMLMPLIMVGQNLLNRHSEMRADADFEVNQKAEREVEAILLHLEDQAGAIEHQGELILKILGHLDRQAETPAAPS